MRHIVISAVTRPHVLCDCHQPCWCKPEREEYEEGTVVIHKNVDLNHSCVERMAVFSEQLTYGLS